jgi:hypothetical protein
LRALCRLAQEEAQSTVEEIETVTDKLDVNAVERIVQRRVSFREERHFAAAQAASAVLSEKTKRSANAEDATKAAQEAALAALARVKAKQVCCRTVERASRDHSQRPRTRCRSSAPRLRSAIHIRRCGPPPAGGRKRPSALAVRHCDLPR